MAIFSKKTNTDEVAETAVVETAAAPQVVLESASAGALVVPRLSEKAGAANRLNKYIFSIYGKMNKVELRKAVEKQYGVKIASVNMVTVKGKSRRFGRRMGAISGFKKAIVTLTKDSKKITLVEPS